MMKPEPPDVESLLKEALADDLPAHVERRLDERLRSFLESRRRSEDTLFPIPAAFRRLALGLLSLVMVVAGLVLHATGTRSVTADSLLRLHDSLALSRALGASTVSACSVAPADRTEGDVVERLSPSAMGERVYRDWVLLRQEPSREGEALTFLFRTRDGRTVFSASCVWDAAATPR
jgi:hypothetical protein